MFPKVVTGWLHTFYTQIDRASCAVLCLGDAPQEKSFKTFCERPENKPLVEKAQRQEVRQALQLRDRSAWLAFEGKVRRCMPARHPLNIFNWLRK